jgi:PAS domain S-box-containing protein
MAPIRLRVLLFALLTMGTFILTAVLMFSYSSSIKKQELTALVQLGEAVSGSAAPMIVDLIIEEDYARLDEICLGYAANPSVTVAYVADDQGRIIADSSALVLGKPLPTFPPPQQTQVSPLLFVEQLKHSALFMRTVVFEDKTFGFILLDISKEKMFTHLRQGQKRNLMIGALFCCLGLVTSWSLALLLIRPLEQMTMMAKDINSSEANLKINSSAILEIEDLANAFQRMRKRITQREHELLTSEKKYRDIFENALEGIFRASAEGNFTTVNPKMASLMGYASPEEFISDVGGLSNRFLLTPEDRHRLLSLLMKQGEVVRHEVQLKGKDQKIIWGSLNIRALYDEGGIVTSFEGLLEDISQQRESAEILADERERLGVTLRSIGDGVISTDREGLITLVNRAAEDMTGWSLDEALGRPLEEVLRLVNGMNGQPSANPVEKVIVSGQIAEMASHTLLIARDGSRKNIADSGAPIRDKDSNIIGVVLVFRDVTELYNMEQEQLKLKKLESLGTLAGGIAHDFNNILAAILGNIDLATHDKGLNEKTGRYLLAAQKASLRAKGLTTQLLTFAKGGTPIKKAASIGELVRESADFVLHGSNVSRTYQIADDLWMAEVDKGQISQVVQNLAINADHAMPIGGELTIHCENCPLEKIEDDFTKTSDYYVKITVTDTGLGIPANVLDQIFDPYFSTKQRGSGLGLSICHSIVTRHDGHIGVQSMPGTGTSFSLYLPASKDQRVSPVRLEEEPSQNQYRSRIMLMDDDEVILDIAQEMLETLGHEVILACDGEEAIALFEKYRENGAPVDVIVMDLTIPGGMGGKEAVLRILDIDPDARVIVSSGYSNDPVMANYQQYGFAAAIDKPYLLQDFVKGIEKCLQVV